MWDTRASSYMVGCSARCEVDQRSAWARKRRVARDVRSAQPEHSDQRERRLHGEAVGREDAAVLADDSHELCGESLLAESGGRHALPALSKCVGGVRAGSGIERRIYSSHGVPLTILSGEGSGHSRMIVSCDWNDNGILTAGLDRMICLWDVNNINKE